MESEVQSNRFSISIDISFLRNLACPGIQQDTKVAVFAELTSTKSRNSEATEHPYRRNFLQNPQAPWPGIEAEETTDNELFVFRHVFRFHSKRNLAFSRIHTSPCAYICGELWWHHQQQHASRSIPKSNFLSINMRLEFQHQSSNLSSSWKRAREQKRILHNYIEIFKNQSRN